MFSRHNYILSLGLSDVVKHTQCSRVHLQVTVEQDGESTAEAADVEVRKFGVEELGVEAPQFETLGLEAKGITPRRRDTDFPRDISTVEDAYIPETTGYQEAVGR